MGEFKCIDRGVDHGVVIEIKQEIYIIRCHFTKIFMCVFISIEKSEWIHIWWKLSKEGRNIRGKLSLFALHVFELFECFQNISYVAIDESTNKWGG